MSLLRPSLRRQVLRLPYGSRSCINGGALRLCYIDEAGDTGALPSSTSPIQPALIISAVVIEHDRLHSLTHGLISLKKKFFPKLLPPGRPHLAWILRELKGADIRKSVRSTNRNERRQVIGLLDGVIGLLDQNDAKVFGRIWIKEIGKPVKGEAVYTSSIQAICTTLQHLLTATGDSGLVIADSRNHALNTMVAHSIFTRKFKNGGDDYASVLELPAFGHSDNHAGLQLCDILCSGLLFPMAMNAYCVGHVSNLHVRPEYLLLRQRYGSAIDQLQYRYWDKGRKRGGLTTDDRLGQRSGQSLFKP